MSKLNPKKLSVEFGTGVSATKPIIRRHYTLTHSDITAELFLVISLQYAYKNFSQMRDEVLGKWYISGNRCFLNVYLHIDDPLNQHSIAIRNMIFRRELPLALEAIRYGDRKFFAAHPELDSAPIIVYFNSSIPYYNKVENWGTPSDYKFQYKKG